MTLEFRNRYRAEMKIFRGCLNVHSDIINGVVHMVFDYMGHRKAISLSDWDVEIVQGN